MENNMMSTPSRYNATMLLWNTEQDTPWLGVRVTIGWLVVLVLTALSDSISVYMGPPPREREKEERNDR